jgi:hypothetical protein
MKLPIILGCLLWLQCPILARSQDTIRSYYSPGKLEANEIKHDSAEARYDDDGTVFSRYPIVNHKKRRSYWSTFGHAMGWVNLRVNH